MHRARVLYYIFIYENTYINKSNYSPTYIGRRESWYVADILPIYHDDMSTSAVIHRMSTFVGYGEVCVGYGVVKKLTGRIFFFESWHVAAGRRVPLPTLVTIPYVTFCSNRTYVYDCGVRRGVYGVHSCKKINRWW